MKVKEAEKLVCPFMSNVNRVVTFQNDGYRHEVKLNEAYTDSCNCITTKCMAWKITKTKSDYETEQYVKDKGYGRKSMQNRPAKLEPQDCEGYCIRLGK